MEFVVVDYENSLYLFAELGKIEKLKLLLKKVKIKKFILEDAFLLAMNNGHYKVADLLLKNGASVHADNNAALSDIAASGTVRGIKFLAQRVDIHMNECYAFRAACLPGNLPIVKFLLTQGANVHAYDGEALHSAITADDIRLAKLLLKSGAHVYAKDAFFTQLAHGHDMVNLLRSYEVK